MRNKRISGITILGIYCPRCGTRHITLVKIATNDIGAEVITLNTTRVCPNKDCTAYICLSEVKSWKKL